MKCHHLPRNTIHRHSTTTDTKTCLSYVCLVKIRKNAPGSPVEIGVSHTVTVAPWCEEASNDVDGNTPASVARWFLPLAAAALVWWAPAITIEVGGTARTYWLWKQHGK